MNHDEVIKDSLSPRKHFKVRAKVRPDHHFREVFTLKKNVNIAPEFKNTLTTTYVLAPLFTTRSAQTAREPAKTDDLL